MIMPQLTPSPQSLVLQRLSMPLTFSFSVPAVLRCGLGLEYMLTQNDASSEVLNLKPRDPIL